MLYVQTASDSYVRTAHSPDSRDPINSISPYDGGSHCRNAPVAQSTTHCLSLMITRLVSRGEERNKIFIHNLAYIISYLGDQVCLGVHFPVSRDTDGFGAEEVDKHDWFRLWR